MSKQQRSASALVIVAVVIAATLAVFFPAVYGRLYVPPLEVSEFAILSASIAALVLATVKSTGPRGFFGIVATSGFLTLIVAVLLR